jgi:predicted RNA-binding protein with PUA-like domain
MRHWLFKSEGDCYSIDDLRRDKKTAWSGVRNYQARNYMMREMSVGDQVLFYHSNSKPTGVYGVARVVSMVKPDVTQFDTKDDHYDPKATKDRPRWYCIDITYADKFDSPVSLQTIKLSSELDGMLVRTPGSRLSIQPVSREHFEHIIKLSR